MLVTLLVSFAFAQDITAEDPTRVHEPSACESEVADLEAHLAAHGDTPESYAWPRGTTCEEMRDTLVDEVAAVHGYRSAADAPAQDAEGWCAQYCSECLYCLDYRDGGSTYVGGEVLIDGVVFDIE